MSPKSLDEKDDDSTSPLAQAIQLILVLGIVAVLVYYFMKALVIGILYWILAILTLGILFVNRKFMYKGYQWMLGVYQKNTWLGVGATLGLLAAFTPLVAGLYLKTLWDFRKSPLLPFNRGKKKAQAGEESDSIIIDITPEEENKKDI